MTRSDVFAWVLDEYGTEPEYLWLGDPYSPVLRNNSGKWYGIIMNIPESKLGLKSNRKIDILNVKSDPMLIDMLVGDYGFFKAYHMNKTNWITISLGGTVSCEIIKEMLAESHRLTGVKMRRIPKCSEKSEE